MDRIALFPLGLVVYPGETLPLHIFEERYLLMVEEALATRSPIGIALESPGQPESAIEKRAEHVGTTVEVVACDRLPDGRMLIATQGRRRFRAHRVVSERPFQEADVEWLDEPIGEPATATRAEAAVRRELERVGAEDVLDEAEDVVAVSYAVAAALDAPLGLKQRILAVDTASDRLLMETAVLKRVASVD